MVTVEELLAEKEALKKENTRLLGEIAQYVKGWLIYTKKMDEIHDAQKKSLREELSAIGPEVTDEQLVKFCRKVLSDE